MTTSTPNLALTLYNSSTDQAEYFSNFRAVIAGTSLSSNFYKIDTAYGVQAGQITALQGVRGAIYVPATYISANYYEATGITDITAYSTNTMIILKLNVASAGTVTLNINSLGTKSVMKINSSGAVVNITGAELMIGKFYLFRYDGTQWIWVSSNSGDQTYIAGTAGNIVTVNSDNTLLGTTSMIVKASGAELNSGTDDSKFATAKAIKDSDTKVGINSLFNSDFSVAQRGTSFTSATVPANNDDTYLLDRWILLSDGNDIVDISQETSSTISDPLYSIKLDVETANKKFGILQILEQKDSRKLINKTVSLSFKAKITGTTIGAIRAGVLTWYGTPDAVTSDVVGAWGGAGTNPTLVAEWNYENIPGDLATPTTSWQTYKIENVSVDTTGGGNVAVFIWVDDVTMSVGDFLHISEVKLEVGNFSTSFEYKSYNEELASCMRYFETFGGGARYAIAVGQCGSATSAYVALLYRVVKRAIANTTFSNVADFLLTNATGTGQATTNITTQFGSDKSIWLTVTVASSLVAGNAAFLYSNVAGTGTIYVESEL